MQVHGDRVSGDGPRAPRRQKLRPAQGSKSLLEIRRRFLVAGQISRFVSPVQDPLVSKCKYFSEASLQSGGDVVELPASSPGVREAFEAVALFCYGDAVALDPFNVAAVRCAAELLGVGGLGARCDLYISQVVLQSWDDALIVLQRCLPLLPAAEELLVVSRCVEALAFMACMEILDPEQRRNQLPGAGGAASRALVGRRWDAELVKELAARDLWVKDLVALPFQFFERIVRALRRQGMKEKYVGPVVLFYANKWVLSKKTHRFWATTDDEAIDGETDANRRAAAILEGVVGLLPAESPAVAANGAIPVAFYFALLSRSLTLELSDESRTKLRGHVASNLRFARVDDLPLPEEEADGRSIADSREVRAMESIVSNHASVQRKGVEAVSELWDRYLLQFAGDPKLRPERLAELIGAIPASDRKTHDHLYEAINTYLVVRQVSNTLDHAHDCDVFELFLTKERVSILSCCRSTGVCPGRRRRRCAATWIAGSCRTRRASRPCRTSGCRSG
jgi:hypothetical protein